MNPRLFSVAIALATVNFIECPKCDRRLRIAEDGVTATINLSRIADADRERMTDRAEWLLHFADDVGRLDFRRPLMGWSSWNTFAVDISESIILDMAHAMASNGLAAVGYRYVNIDDGFFGGRDAAGRLRVHPTRFPRGLKPTVDGIHALGLKAGIYSEGGTNTCGSIWNGDGYGCNSGLYGHDADDCRFFFNDLGFDFIKVDFCGGTRMKLDERQRYTEIARAIRATGREVRFNVCRWAYPGAWVADIAESWRTTEDIRANWASIRRLIRENLYLGAYVSPGHYNDLDMLEVGRRRGATKSTFWKGDTGLTEDEEVTHFGMWCMLSSPLLIGCDIRCLPEFTRKLITNRYLLAMNQNDLGLSGYVAARSGDAYLLVKDAEARYGRRRFAALVNLSDSEQGFRLTAAALDLEGTVSVFDLRELADLGEFDGAIEVRLPKHSARFWLVEGSGRLERKVYEAESARLSAYQELKDPLVVNTAYCVDRPQASGGMVVTNLGGRPENDLVWPEVKVDRAGRRKLSIRVATPCDRWFTLAIDGVKVRDFHVYFNGGEFQTLQCDCELTAGVHSVRLYSSTGYLPDVDQMTLD